MKKAVIYARVSSTIERNRQNTERQVSDLKAYAEFAKLEVVEVFEEYISGGKRNDERPILQDTIDYCIENKVDFLLVNDYIYSHISVNVNQKILLKKHLYFCNIYISYHLFSRV